MLRNCEQGFEIIRYVFKYERSRGLGTVGCQYDGCIHHTSIQLNVAVKFAYVNTFIADHSPASSPR